MQSGGSLEERFNGQFNALGGVNMGPLEGLKILEIAGIGPGPFAAMMLSDMGAEVCASIARSPCPGGDPDRRRRSTSCSRGRRSIALDLKNPEGSGDCRPEAGREAPMPSSRASGPA